ncbi:pyruvate:ferredoxin (flavodoxin) oxidoreductase [Serratia liquefaciens]|nr:pyruvate:ferredoxin (flavodoxin) oxidoreductase [Serratia liquefaciens]
MNCQAAQPKPRFTVGIYDDVTNLSLPLGENTLPAEAKLEALFYGLGSDGSVSATKNNIKIIGNSTPWFSQGYFVYDSKKAGGSPSRICGSAKNRFVHRI